MQTLENIIYGTQTGMFNAVVLTEANKIHIYPSETIVYLSTIYLYVL